MKKLSIIIAFLMLGCITLVQAQTVRITGTVKGAQDGLAIPGVSVVVKGTQLGVTTDLDGNYALNVPTASTTISFSFVGMKAQDVEIGGRTVIDVALESESIQVEELVVTALGISRAKKSLSYSVQDVKGDALTQGGNPDMVTSLSGKIAGVQIRQSSGMPGAPSQMYIRGARSFSGNNSPLYVVDGMPISSENDYGSNVTGSAYSNRTSDIDPNDIESINVLKGQTAAALYGLRASNGVIIITTKKGKGAKIGKPIVNFNSGYTIDAVSTLPEMQQTYAQGTGGAFAPMNSMTWGPKITDLPTNATYGGDNYPGHAGEFFDPYKNAWVTPTAYNNPKKFFSENGITKNNSLSVSGANAFGNYSIAFSATNQTGIIASTGMDRYTGKMGGDFKLAEKWNLGFSGNFSDGNIKKLPSGNDSWLFAVYGAPASFDLMGTPYHQEGTFGNYRQISYRSGIGVNPRWATVNNHYYEQTKRFFGNSYLEFKPTTWANVKYQIGADMYTTNNEDYQEVGHANFPTAAQLPTPNNPVYAFVQPTGGRINNYGVTRRVVNSLLTANFRHSFATNLNANLLIGNEIDQNNSEYYAEQGSGFTTPGWNNMSNTTTQTTGYTKFKRRTVGFFSNISVDYMNMLFLNITGRYDVVSSMPRGNRGFFYPSASLGFIFTELNVLKDQKVLSFGKFRLSYAEVGQAATAYNSEPVFVTGGAGSGFLSYGITYPFGTVSGYKPSRTLYDPQLKPQNTRTYETGFDLKFLNNRVAIDYTYSYQDANDQIFGVPLAGSAGFGTLTMNAGRMVTNSHELVLTGTPITNKNVDWTVTVNFSKVESICKELAKGVDNISLGGYTTPNIRASVGDSYPTIYGEQYVKDAQGRILVNENPASDNYGFPMVGSFGKIGDVSPDFILGASSNVSLFKLVSVFAGVEWKSGGHMYSGSNRLMDLYGTTKRTEDRESSFIYDGYKADGTRNDIARGGTTDPRGNIFALQTLQNTLSSLPEAQVYETSFVKLREIGINVIIPKKYTQHLFIERASVGFVARNILLWTTLPNFDPETSQGQGNMQGGMDYMSLPQTTSYGFSLNLSF